MGTPWTTCTQDVQSGKFQCTSVPVKPSPQSSYEHVQNPPKFPCGPLESSLAPLPHEITHLLYVSIGWFVFPRIFYKWKNMF